MNKEFLCTLLDNMSVSGHEIGLQKKVIQEMTPYCDCIRTDNTGNVISILNPDAPFKVMLAAHIDEIGMIVTHIQEDGLVRVGRSGGIMPRNYPGHQVVIHGFGGTVYGSVVNNKDMDKAELKVNELYVDIGAKNAADARQYIEEGDPIHIHSYHQDLLNGFFAARGIDDRGCAYIILEALKLAKEKGCKTGVYAATTVGEETTMRGAYWAASGVKPDVSIVVDVTFASDYPGVDSKESGQVKLGNGPVICHGSITNKKVIRLLKDCAKEAGIPYQVEAYMGSTYTDADKIHFTGEGVVTALVSLPLRYMHSPSEVCHLDDIDASIRLLAEFLCRIGEDFDPDPFRE